MGRIIRNGIEYGSGNENATNINYDGAVSGLEATTVQEAIDKLAASEDTIDKDWIMTINPTAINSTVDFDYTKYKEIKIVASYTANGGIATITFDVFPSIVKQIKGDNRYVEYASVYLSASNFAMVGLSMTNSTLNVNVTQASQTFAYFTVFTR